MPTTQNNTDTTSAGARIKSYIERISRLEDEKKGLGQDIREIYSEAKGMGFEPKIIRKLVKLARMDANHRREESELLESYSAAIGLD